MSRQDAARPSELRWRASRTRTARQPLKMPHALSVSGRGTFDELYAGTPSGAAATPRLPGLSITDPMPGAALQCLGATSDSDGAITLVLDLRRSVDVARIELYGNLLLPPVREHGRPRFNFGLPRAIAVAVSTELGSESDLHGRATPTSWPGAFESWQPRFASHDLRALWGWTPLHLPPTYGRYLLLHFEDLPEIYA